MAIHPLGMQSYNTVDDSYHGNTLHTSRMHGIVGEQKQVVATVLQRPVCVHAEQQQACL